MKVGKFELSVTDLAIVGGIGLALYVWLRGSKIFTQDLPALGQFAVESASGAIIAIGKTVGIPETDPAVCEDYIRTGNTAMASLYCPAGTYILARTGEILSPTGMLMGFTGIQGVVDFVNLFMPGTLTPITSYSPEESGLAEQVLDGGTVYENTGVEWDTSA